MQKQKTSINDPHFFYFKPQFYPIGLFLRKIKLVQHLKFKEDIFIQEWKTKELWYILSIFFKRVTACDESYSAKSKAKCFFTHT